MISAWADKIASRFHPESSELWVAVDPDDLLLTPAVSRALAEKGFTLLPLRSPMAFRLEYETAISLPQDERRPILVHLGSTNEDRLPWDIKSEARIERFSLANLLPNLDPKAVRAVGPEHFDSLFDASRELDPKQSLGESATRDYIATYVYGVVPNLIRKPVKFWETCFRLFFANDELPILIATHVASKAVLPASMSVAAASELLSSRAAFVERVQSDWLLYANEITDAKAPDDTLIPFGAAEIRSNLDTMVLDGTIQPAAIDAVPTNIPNWMRVGLIENDGALRRLLEQKIGLLADDIPMSAASHSDWLAFAARQAEAIAAFNSLPHQDRHLLLNEMTAVRRQVDDAFFEWLTKEFGALSSVTALKSPAMVHQAARHLAHRRHQGVLRQALIVVDGLSLDQWSIIEQHTRQDVPEAMIDTKASFAWLPTLTSVSRQAIFAGDLPRTFSSAIASTSGEAAAWKRFWVDEGIAERDIFYAKGLGLTGSYATAMESSVKAGTPVIGVVINTVDEMLHGAVLGKPAVANDIREWLNTGEWDRMIRGLISNGYEIYVTADHGNVEAVGIGRPSEGVAAEQRGERARVYDSVALRDKLLGSVAGSKTLTLGGLPANYLPVFAPFDVAFMPLGAHAVVHGGPSVEEVIVPFARITKREKL